MKTCDQIIADYKAAYLRANGYDVTVYYEAGGWYQVHGFNHRRTDMLKATINLLKRPVYAGEKKGPFG